MDSSLQTFRPPPPPQQPTSGRREERQHQHQQPEIQLQQEQIQYVDNDCCQVAVTTNATMDSATIKKTTAGTMSRAKTDTMKSVAAAHQFSTLERNMAEVAEQNRRSERELRSQATMDRRSHYGASCDTCDAPLTPASLAGIDHRDLEHRPLTRSVTRATVYDEPPEK